MRNRRHSRARVIKSTIYFVIFCVLLIVIFRQFTLNKSLIKPDPFSAMSSPPTPLEQAMKGALSEGEGEYAISIKNLKTNETFDMNAHKVFQTGSLYKLWIMATVFNQIQSEKLKINETLSADVVELNKAFGLSPEEADLQEGTVNFTVKSALNQMITISHNYAALILTKKIRLLNVAKFLTQVGLNESKVGIDNTVPTSTAADITLFLEKLYKGNLANTEYTTAMINLLKNQKLNSKLPKLLAPEVIIAHKTGELSQFSHDAGIVYTPKGDYIIVVLSKTARPDQANDRIAVISKAVYDYFEK